MNKQKTTVNAHKRYLNYYSIVSPQFSRKKFKFFLQNPFYIFKFARFACWLISCNSEPIIMENELNFYRDDDDSDDDDGQRTNESFLCSDSCYIDKLVSAILKAIFGPIVFSNLWYFALFDPSFHAFLHLQSSDWPLLGNKPGVASMITTFEAVAQITWLECL